MPLFDLRVLRAVHPSEVDCFTSFLNIFFPLFLSLFRYSSFFYSKTETENRKKWQQFLFFFYCILISGNKIIIILHSQNGVRTQMVDGSIGGASLHNFYAKH